MKKRCEKAILFLLVILMVLLSGCGQEEENEGKVNESRRTVKL